MRTIKKGPEPASLKQYRNEAGANYEDYNGKEDLRESLVAEQGGICCYCMTRISPKWSAMRIEHWRCQKDNPDKDLEYGNLLGACTGNEKLASQFHHCDKSKGHKNLSRNPAVPEHHIEALISYSGDGTICSSDEVFNRELNEVLNLNEASLKNRRMAVLDGFISALPKVASLKRPFLERKVRDLNGEVDGGRLQPFCGVVLYWLRKRLARL